MLTVLGWITFLELSFVCDICVRSKEYRKRSSFSFRGALPTAPVTAPVPFPPAVWNAQHHVTLTREHRLGWWPLVDGATLRQSRSASPVVIDSVEWLFMCLLALSLWRNVIHFGVFKFFELGLFCNCWVVSLFVYF